MDKPDTRPLMDFTLSWLKLKENIEVLRHKLADQAWGIERTHGYDDLAAKAFRACIADLYSIAQDSVVFPTKTDA